MTLQTPPQLAALTLNDRPTYPWWGFFQRVASTLSPGIDATIVLAKITGGGVNGSFTVVKGIITAYTPPT